MIQPTFVESAGSSHHWCTFTLCTLSISVYLPFPYTTLFSLVFLLFLLVLVLWYTGVVGPTAHIAARVGDARARYGIRSRILADSDGWKGASVIPRPSRCARYLSNARIRTLFALSKNKSWMTRVPVAFESTILLRCQIFFLFFFFF